MRTRGGGVQNPENFADVLYVWSPTSVIRRSMNNISTVYGAIQKYTRNLFYNGQMEFQLHSSSVTYCSIYIFDSLWAKKTSLLLGCPLWNILRVICVEEKHPRLLVWGYINDVSRVGGGQFLTKGREVAWIWYWQGNGVLNPENLADVIYVWHHVRHPFSALKVDR